MINSNYQQEINDLIRDLRTWNYLDWNEHPYEHKEKIDNAIKELEDIQNRSCNNCKYNKEQDGVMIYCEKEMCLDGSKMMWHSFTKDFCCKYWESKNESTEFDKLD